jgi:hypothetical protein
MSSKRASILLAGLVAFGLTVRVESADAQVPLGTAFTYQGQLEKDGRPVNESCDFELSLYGVPQLGVELGVQLLEAVDVTNGRFTVQLGGSGEFAGAFRGEARWLQIAVLCPAGGDGAFATLVPRQELTASPNALFSTSVPWGGITGMPAAFQDGVDNDTQYTAGDGLVLNGTVFGVAFAGSGSAATAARSDHAHSEYLRADASAQYSGGTLMFQAGSTLKVDGALDASAATSLGLPQGVVTSAHVADGTIVNVDISPTAGIVDMKLATIQTPGKVADTALSANVSKLGQSIDSSEIEDGTITDVDISPTAGIVDTKLATIQTPGKVADSALSDNVSKLGQSIDSSEIEDGTITSADISPTADIQDGQISDALTIDGGTIDNTPIGQDGASTGAFTDLAVSGEVKLQNAETISNEVDGVVRVSDGTRSVDFDLSGGVHLLAQDASADRPGASVVIEAGAGDGEDQDGGNVTLRPGAATGAGAPGEVRVASGQLVLDSDNAASSGAAVEIVARQGLDPDGILRYNAAEQCWEISTDGGATFSPVVTEVKNTSGNADLLDGLDSTQFLRSDETDSFTVGTLTLEPGTTLKVDGALDASTATSVSLPQGVITSAHVADGTIADVDISLTAGIVDTKLATIQTPGKVADTALSDNVSKLGQSIDSSEIEDGTITSANISPTADIQDGQISDALTIDGGSIDDTAIGTTTAAAGRFTDVTVTTSGLTVEAGGLIVESGGLTVEDGALLLKGAEPVTPVTPWVVGTGPNDPYGSLQAAFDAAKAAVGSGRKVIYVKPGTYPESVLIDSPSTHVVGQTGGRNYSTTVTGTVTIASGGNGSWTAVGINAPSGQPGMAFSGTGAQSLYLKDTVIVASNQAALLMTNPLGTISATNVRLTAGAAATGALLDQQAGELYARGLEVEHTLANENLDAVSIGSGGNAPVFNGNDLEIHGRFQVVNDQARVEIGAAFVRATVNPIIHGDTTTLPSLAIKVSLLNVLLDSPVGTAVSFATGDVFAYGQVAFSGPDRSLDAAQALALPTSFGAATVAGPMTPNVSATHDLGASGQRWKDGFFSGTVTANSFSGSFTGSGAAITGVDADTFDGMDSSAFAAVNHVHDERYYTESELNTSGAGGQVHWDNLTNKPAGLDDGDDDTTYSAAPGGGLNLNESNELSVDPAVFQKRVGGSCPGGAIQSIGADGSVTCQSSSGSGSLQQLAASFVVAADDSVNAGDVVRFLNGIVTSGSGTSGEVVFNSGSTNTPSAVALSATQFVVVYRDNGNSGFGTAVVGTVSGSSISFGSEVVFNSASTYDSSVAALSATQVVVVYRDGGNSNFGTAVVGTVSGSSISFGSEGVFNSAQSVYTSVVALSATEVVVVYRDDGNSSFETAVVGTVSGSSISFGSEVVFSSAGWGYPSVAALSATEVVVVYVDHWNGFLMAVVGTVSGSSISFGSEFAFSAQSEYPSVAALSATQFVVVYRDRRNSWFGKAAMMETLVMNGALLGIAKTAANGGESVPVVFLGISDGHSALVPGALYYGHLDGSLSAGPSGVRMGRAISPTQILLDSQ